MSFIFKKKTESTAPAASPNQSPAEADKLGIAPIEDISTKAEAVEVEDVLTKTDEKPAKTGPSPKKSFGLSKALTRSKDNNSSSGSKPKLDLEDKPQPEVKKSVPNSKQGKPQFEAEPGDHQPVRPVLVEFKELVKRYGQHTVLDHVNLKLYKGEFLSVVGPSGAGKSTLIKCLTLQERPDQGRIVVAGRDITLLRTRELPYYRRKVGIVFQDFKLLASKTVYENVAFALEVSNTSSKQIKQQVSLILDTVGMLPKANNFPKELSGGEQQRAAIARALVHDPKILIADEPTGNLDPVNTWEIIDLLFKINKSGTMVILATHDREIVDALKKRVIAIRAGKVVSDQEKGTYLV